LTRFVARSSDARLERTLGTRPALRLLFAVIARRLDPIAAGDFSGTVRLELRTAGGRVRVWTLEIAGGRARTRSGPMPDPRVTVRAGVADFLRLAAGDLGLGRALLARRLDLAGDFAAAQRLGKMFSGSSSA
jgi:putative sterol carrier protein